MAGLVPAIHVFTKNAKRLFRIDRPRLDCRRRFFSPPRPWPMFDIMLSLYGGPNIVERFEVNETFQSMTLGKAFRDTSAMFIYATYEIARDADIQNSVWSVRHEVDVAACHVLILKDVDGRDKPGHDESKGIRNFFVEAGQADA